mgnify:CR=1 FL=1
MTAYEFYWRDETGREHLLGILPERRKNRTRITPESIINWGKKIIVENSKVKDIFFARVEID